MSETYVFDKFGNPKFWITSETKPGDHFFSFQANRVHGWDDEKRPVDPEKYLHGTIGWDSCSHLYFGIDGGYDGYVDMGGVSDFQDHIALLKFLYELAFECMGQKPQDGEEWS